MSRISYNSLLSKTKAIREKKRVCLSSAGLNALGLVSYEVLSDITSTPINSVQLEDELTERLQGLESIDWERTAPMWDGNVVVNGAIKTQTPAVRGAAAAMIDLSLLLGPDPQNGTGKLLKVSFPPLVVLMHRQRRESPDGNSRLVKGGS